MVCFLGKSRLINFLLALYLGSHLAPAQNRDVDVVIYGGTSAAIASAVQVKRMGKSVVVISPDIHLGGLSSSGLGWTDSGKKQAIGGIAREFYHRVWRHYQGTDAWEWELKDNYGNRGQGSPAIDGDRRTMWIFEPKVAEMIFESWVKEHEIDVIRDEWLDREKGVKLEGGKIISITSLSGNIYKGKIFLDCTYEGDLMASSGVSYFVGREANSVYGETLSGVQTKNAKKHQFSGMVDPFVKEGNPNSGLLARISSSGPGKEGEGDSKMQAYNFRVCLTQIDENRVPFPKPQGYDPSQYELLLRTLQMGSRHVFGKFDPIPNAKTDTNNHGPFSTDNIGMNYNYPEGSYEQRKAIVSEHEQYQKGYFYFLCNDPRVPEDVRERMSRWGLAKDEFKDNGNWPNQIYVREARRMIGDFVMTELHLRGRKETLRSVGMGSYNMDSHNVQRYVAKDEQGRAYVLNEGDIQVNPGGPYKISYDSLIPKANECSNLIVPVCISSSHIAFGSIRMEPVFMILGQSAATAAVIAINEGKTVQSVPYEKLKMKLLEDGQVLEVEERNIVSTGLGIDPSKLEGLVIDGALVKFSGEWIRSSSLRPFVGNSYFHDGNTAKGMCTADFPFKVEKNGLHEVQVSFLPHGNRAGSVNYELTTSNGKETVTIDQRRKSDGENLWHSLGSFQFTANQNYSIKVSNEGTEGFVIVDSARIIPLVLE
tara:strand:+ start:1249 stop:3375 length:2127 start_codon:yes stop_codon:yes gene_type:complete